MLGVHLMTWGGYQSGYFQGKSYLTSAVSIDWVDLKVLTVMTTFFMAFYVNQSFQRYQEIYLSLFRLFTKVYDFASLARLAFANNRSAERLGCRWLASSTLLCLEELAEEHGELPEELWQKHETWMVRRSEVELLKQLNSMERVLLMSRRTAELCKSQLEEEEFQKLLVAIMNFKECQQELLDLAKLEVPFSYQHLLKVMVFLTLFFLAYGMALSESSMAPGLFIIMELVLLGMLDLSVDLWNPFRSKNLFFTMDQWKEDFRFSLHTILNYEHAGPDDHWEPELEEEKNFANPNLLSNPNQLQQWLEGDSPIIDGLSPRDSPRAEEAEPRLESLQSEGDTTRIDRSEQPSWSDGQADVRPKETALILGI
ncbi:unnamed protein product [Durusdinium trenchii]